MFLFTAYSVTHSHERNIVAANASCIVVICDVLFSYGKSVKFSVSLCSFVISDANVALGRVIFKNVAAHIFRAAMARNEGRWKPLNLETQTVANAAEVHQSNGPFLCLLFAAGQCSVKMGLDRVERRQLLRRALEMAGISSSGHSVLTILYKPALFTKTALAWHVPSWRAGLQDARV